MTKTVRKYNLSGLIEPFTAFSTLDWDLFAKIRQHDWKEHPKINKVAKLESNLFKTYEDIAPQIRKNFTDGCMVVVVEVGGGGEGGGGQV